MAKVSVTFSGEFVGEYSLDRPASVIGREATCDIQIDNLGVSRAHCQIVKRGNTYILQDMNSANGTYVNGRQIDEHYLNDGDEFLVGKFMLKFDATGVAAERSRPDLKQQPEVMGDGLRTYVVDGAKIRERLADMQGAETERQASAPDSSAAPAPQPPAGRPPVPTAGPRRAIDHALDFDPLKPRSRPGTQHLRQKAEPAAPAGGSRAVLYLSLATNVVLIALVVVMIVLMMKLMNERRPAREDARPATSAPAEEGRGAD